MKDRVRVLAETNDYTYNLLKAAEELQELSLVLTQLVLKPKKVKLQEVIDEIGDVKIRMGILDNLFDNKMISERVEYKLAKFNQYLEEGKYKGGI